MRIIVKAPQSTVPSTNRAGSSTASSRPSTSATSSSSSLPSLSSSRPHLESGTNQVPTTVSNPSTSPDHVPSLIQSFSYPTSPPTSTLPHQVAEHQRLCSTNSIRAEDFSETAQPSLPSLPESAKSAPYPSGNSKSQSHVNSDSTVKPTASKAPASSCKNFVSESSTSHAAALSPRQVSVNDAEALPNKEEGYNSSDERAPSRIAASTDIEQHFERELKEKRGWVIRKMAQDGNCLFRAVADQVYGDAEMHDVVRSQVVDFMRKNRDHYSQFVTEDFDLYLERKSKNRCFGNHLEIQAFTELYHRPVEVYSYSLEPQNIFHQVYRTENAPIRLTYHQGNHYNALIDPDNPSVGVGLGLPAFEPGLADKLHMKSAMKSSELEDVEKRVLQSSLKASLKEWEDQLLNESLRDWEEQQLLLAKKASLREWEQQFTQEAHWDARREDDWEQTQREIEQAVLAASRASYLAFLESKEQGECPGNSYPLSSPHRRSPNERLWSQYPPYESMHSSTSSRVSSRTSSSSGNPRRSPPHRFSRRRTPPYTSPRTSPPSYLYKSSWE